MGFNAQGFWTPEDDDVQAQVSKVVNADGALMKQARGVGALMANKRGLGNASIAIGASQGEVLKKATEIGGQSAAQIASKNLAKLNQTEDTARATTIQGMADSAARDRLEAELGSRAALQAGQLAAQQSIAQMEADNALKLQKGEIDFKTAQGEQERINALKLQQNELGSREALTAQELASREGISQAELEAAMARQSASEAAATARQQAEIAATATDRDKTIASQEKLSNTDTQTRLTIAEADRAAQANATAVSAATTMAAAHMQASAAVMNNPDIPAAAREAYAKSIQAATEANIGLVEQISGVDLAWGNNPKTGTSNATNQVAYGSGKQIVATQGNNDGSTIVRYADGTEETIMGTVNPVNWT